MPAERTAIRSQPPAIELWHGGCMEVLGGITPGCVDMVFADPPYNLSNGGFTCQSGRAASVNKGGWDRSAGIEADFELHRQWIAACQRVLRDGGTIWVTGTYHSIYACGFALQLAGFKLLNDIAWYKPNASPNLSCRYFTASHETAIWARKGAKAKHTFNYDAMRDGGWPEDSLKRPGKQMRSVWSITTPKKDEKRHGKHPTQKPLALLERMVLAATEPGDLVLDPFCGSGTSGVACALHGRAYVGIDSEEEYLDIARKRITDALTHAAEQHSRAGG
jgi:site-specific DNA-methyltransferase (adenine-specific)